MRTMGTDPSILNQSEHKATKCHDSNYEFDAWPGLSVRARNVLDRANIRDFAQLAEFSEEELLRLPCAGSKTVAEFRDFIQRHRAQAKSNCLSNRMSSDDSDGESEAALYEAFRQAFMSLSVRARNALLQNGLTEPLKLCSMSEDAIRGIRAVGTKTVREIMDLQAKVWGLLTEEQRNLLNPSDEDEDAAVVNASVTSQFESLLHLSEEEANTAFDLVLTTLPRFKSVARSTLMNDGRRLSDIQSLIQYLEEHTSKSGVAFQAIDARLRVLAETISACGDKFRLETAATAIYNLSCVSPPPPAVLSPLLLGRIGPRICRILAPKEIHISAVVCGFGLDPNLRSLEALGQAVGLSRERVRQIQQLALSILTEYPGLLVWIADNARSIVDQFGGCIGASDLEFELLGHRSVKGQGRLPPSVRFFALGTEWMEAGLTVNGDIVQVNGFGQQLMAEVDRVIYNAAQRAADDQPSSNLWSASLEAVVRQVAFALDAQYAPGVRLSEAIVRASIANQNDILRLEGERVYCLRYWQLVYGTLPERVEAVLLQAGCPLHYSDIYASVKQWNRTEREINSRNAIERSSNVMLWDRGTYVHRLCVQIPYDLLREIRTWLEQKLTASVPYVSIAGIFDTFAHRCVEAGIPNRHALYGVLRQSSSNDLDFSEYPYVRRRSAAGQRLPVPIVVESFIQNAGGFVPRSEVNSFMEHELSVNVSLIPVHLYNIPNVLFGSSDVIHIDNLRLDTTAVSELVAYCESKLARYAQISVGTLLKTRRVLCARAGIDDSRLLHSVIVHFSKGRFTGEHPHIVHSGNEGSIASISDIAADFVRTYSAPCSMQVLTQYLVDERGYEARHVYMVNYDVDIVRFSASTVVHLDVIEWNPEKQLKLSELARQTYTAARERGELWGRISSIIEQYETQMPNLVNAVWTETLLASLLRRDSDWLLIGTAKDAFVPRDNPESINQLDSAVELLLDRDYSGASQREPFEEDLRERGLIHSKITQSMLGKTSQVVVTADSVMLRRFVDAR